MLSYLGKKPFTKYSFNLYVNGPYSSELANDYYELEDISAKAPDLSSGERETFDWFVSHDPKWLETASTVLLIHKDTPGIGPEMTYSTLLMSKPWVDKSLFHSIYSDLEREKLIR